MSTYQCMYVLPEDKYKLLISSSIQSPTTPNDAAFTLPNSPLTIEQSLFKCNICKKVFKNKKYLQMHLAAHKPQAGPGSDKPEGRTEFPSEVRYGTLKLQCSICNKNMKHKRNLSRHMKLHKNLIQLNASKWETLT